MPINMPYSFPQFDSGVYEPEKMRALVEELEKIATALNRQVLSQDDLYGENVVFADADATPDVSSKAPLFWTSASGPLTITDFDGGEGGQIVTVLSKEDITYDTTSTNLIGSSVDLVTATGDITVWIRNHTSNWRLLSFVNRSEDNSTGA